MSPTAANALREHSLKATPQRIAIYDYLYNSREHPTAEKIYEELCPSFPSMSFSTVYKTLEIFKEKNLIIELNAGESFFRYDANVDSHAHFLCLNCRALLDAGEKEDIAPPKALSGCKVLFERSYFFGYCPCCAKEEHARHA